jgi:hypothetical protein
MIGISIANSLGFTGPSVLPDASSQAYFAATGITGATQQAAIDNLVKGLKADGLWSKMKAVYPFVTDNRNLLGYTEDFSNAAWTKESATITSNSVIAPNGTTTADTFTATATNALHYLSQNVSITTGNIITFSCYVKNNGGNFVQLVAGASDFIPISPYQNFNLQTGTLASGNITNSTITNVGNGWFRITSNLTCTSTGTASFFIVPILNGITGRVDAFTGDGTSGIYIWGAQLELGSTATTYQPIATTQQAFIASQFKFNLVNPVDSDAAFRLVFNGGWTHSSNGATPNGTNGYADTKLNPSLASIAASSMHISTYLRTNNDGVYCDIGAYDGNPANYQISTYARISNICYVDLGAQLQTRQTYANTDSSGYYVASRTANNVLKAFKNNNLKATNTNTNTASMLSKNIFISANNDTAGTVTQFSTRQQAFATIGDGLTDTEAANLYTRVQAYQTALSRQV